jgi:hypothetical protein
MNNELDVLGLHSDIKSHIYIVYKPPLAYQIRDVFAIYYTL